MTISNNAPSEFPSASPEETLTIGTELSKHLIPGQVVILSGELGTGKTLLVKGIAKGYDILETDVTSPTFTLVNEYYGDAFLVHMDVYRLETAMDFEYLDLEFYREQNAIILIEWGERFKDSLPKDCLTIHISSGKTNQRLIVLEQEIIG